MLRRLVLAATIGAALVGGSLGGSPTAQAQGGIYNCQLVMGNAAGCSESHFGQDTGPAPGTVIVTDDGRVMWPTNVAAQTQPATTTQAGPRPEVQDEAHE
jgi:hypothetical protein